MNKGGSHYERKHPRWSNLGGLLKILSIRRFSDSKTVIKVKTMLYKHHKHPFFPEKIIEDRNSRSQMFCKIGVLKNS